MTTHPIPKIRSITVTALALGLTIGCSPGRLGPANPDLGASLSVDDPLLDAGADSLADGSALDASGPDASGPAPCGDGGAVCQPFEVCDGEPLSDPDTHRCCSGTCRLPRSFDWRDRHGRNWNSPVRNQGPVGACSYFGAMAPIEAAINLYYNQQLDIDLSEQTPSSCAADIYRDRDQSDGVNRCLSLGGPAALICRARFKGIPDEDCFPFILDVEAYYDSQCDSICEDHEDRMWRVTNFIQLLGDAYFAKYVLDEQTNQLVYAGLEPERANQKYLTVDKLKRYIIETGPVAADGALDNHSASIVGWDVIEDTPGDQALHWILKNSWGEDWEDAGYGTTTRTMEDFSSVGVVLTPIIPPPGTSYTIHCEDRDGDGFCNWGISPSRPDSCTASCETAPDWNDADPAVGALGRY